MFTTRLRKILRQLHFVPVTDTVNKQLPNYTCKHLLAKYYLVLVIVNQQLSKYTCKHLLAKYYLVLVTVNI